MSSNDYQPSSWMREAFGESSADVATALARSAMTAQTDGHEAKAGSRLSTNEPYGATTWLAFAHETAAELEAIGAEAIRPARCRYRVGIIEGTLVLAVKLLASTKGVETMSIKSAIRQRILRLASANGDSTLDFGDDYEFTDSDGQVVADAEFGTATRAVLVVMEGNARSGVEHLHIGDVRVDGTGAVLWVHREELPTAVSASSNAGLVALDLDQSADSFAAGSVPTMTLGLVASEADETGTDTDGSDDGS